MTTLEFLRRDVRSFDYLLTVLVIALASFGVLMIGAVAEMQTFYAGLPAQQRLHVITGVIIMLVAAFVDYRLVAKLFIPIYALCILLLVAVLLIGPDAITGTARWIRVPLPGGLDMSMQPSEFAKIFLLIFFAKFVDFKNINHPLWLFLYLVLAAIPVILIERQPSLSASLVVLALALIMLVLAGLYLRIILPTLALMLPAGILLFFDMMRETPIFITRILAPHQWERIQTFLYPIPGSDEARQIEGSLFAMGTGGLTGKGFGNLETWVIHQHNDFIMAAVGEQFGFVGSVILLGVMALVILKCAIVAYRATDKLGRMIAGGVAGLLLFQTFVNVGVTTALLPNTGMPFPFLSYGGTSMWVHMAAIGMVLNVDLTRAREKKRED